MIELNFPVNFHQRKVFVEVVDVKRLFRVGGHIVLFLASTFSDAIDYDG